MPRVSSDEKCFIIRDKGFIVSREVHQMTRVSREIRQTLVGMRHVSMTGHLSEDLMGWPMRTRIAAFFNGK